MNASRRLGLLAVCALTVSGWPAKAWCVSPLVTDVGIGTFVHPLQKPHMPDLSGANFDHVHIFAINGVDPLCVGNFNGLCSYLKSHGFPNTHFYQLYYCTDLAPIIRKVRGDDPGARIVLMGYSMGCNRARALALRLGRTGTEVDLLVYIAGDAIWDEQGSCPKTVHQVLNIRSHGCSLYGGDLVGLHGADLPGAHNYKVNTLHFRAPSRRETVEYLMDDLLAIAGTPHPVGAPLRGTPVPPGAPGPIMPGGPTTWPSGPVTPPLPGGPVPLPGVPGPAGVPAPLKAPTQLPAPRATPAPTAPMPLPSNPPAKGPSAQAPIAAPVQVSVMAPGPAPTTPSPYAFVPLTLPAPIVAPPQMQDEKPVTPLDAPEGKGPLSK